MHTPTAASPPASPPSPLPHHAERARYQIAPYRTWAGRQKIGCEKKLYTCSFEDCGKLFWNSSHKRVHERFHRGERPFACPEPDCDKAFHQRSDMLRHLGSHENNKPYDCPVVGCQKRFASKHYLQIHQMWHDQLAPYCCPVPLCGRRFRARYYVQRHLITHSREHPWVCPVIGCGRRFAQRGNLHSHWCTHGVQERNSPAARQPPASGTPGSGPPLMPAASGLGPHPLPENIGQETAAGLPDPYTSRVPTPLLASWPLAATGPMEPAGLEYAMPPWGSDSTAAAFAPAAWPVPQPAPWPPTGDWQEPARIDNPPSLLEGTGQPVAGIWHGPDGQAWYRPECPMPPPGHGAPFLPLATGTVGRYRAEARPVARARGYKAPALPGEQTAGNRLPAMAFWHRAPAAQRTQQDNRPAHDTPPYP